MSRAIIIAATLAASACDIRPLTSTELYGAAGATGAAGTVGAAGTSGVAGTTGAAGTEAADGGMPDANVPETAPEVPAPGCPPACAADQFCDELAGRCAPRTGVGMLSGQVTDVCSGNAVEAVVGIAGRHKCVFTGKGSYFFTQLPLGRLKLTAAKEGYEVYGATVDIVPGGVIHDIKLMRVGGCNAPAPPALACTCTMPTCEL